MSILEVFASPHSKTDAKIAALDTLSKELSFPVNFSASSEVLREFLASAYHDNSPVIVGKTISIITTFLAQLTRNEGKITIYCLDKQTLFLFDRVFQILFDGISFLFERISLNFQ